jgi:hypothetical protein
MNRYHITIAIVPDPDSIEQDWFFDQEFDSSLAEDEISDFADRFTASAQAGTDWIAPPGTVGPEPGQRPETVIRTRLL